MAKIKIVNKKDYQTVNDTVNDLLRSQNNEDEYDVVKLKSNRKLEEKNDGKRYPQGFMEKDEKQLQRKQNKQIIKDATKTKRKSLFGFISSVNRDLSLSDENEDVALLCDQMHFDAKEAYKLLRTNILFCLTDNNKCRTIGITSAIRGEGKSIVAINLAYTFAATNAKVLLIDMDMRLPTVAKKLHLQPGLGLSDYLIGTVGFKDIVRKHEKYSNWEIVLSGSIPPAPSELIGSDNMKTFIKALEKKYDFIIIDLPPVNVVSDALVAKNIVDGFVLAVRQNFSDKHSLADCLRQLTFIDANILGFVMTDATDATHIGKKYGKYYKKYGKYYKKHYKYYGKSSSYYGYSKQGEDNKQ